MSLPTCHRFDGPRYSNAGNICQIPQSPKGESRCTSLTCPAGGPAPFAKLAASRRTCSSRMFCFVCSTQQLLHEFESGIINTLDSMCSTVVVNPSKDRALVHLLQHFRAVIVDVRAGYKAKNPFFQQARPLGVSCSCVRPRSARVGSVSEKYSLFSRCILYTRTQHHSDCEYRQPNFHRHLPASALSPISASF